MNNNKNGIAIPEYTKEDFLSTNAPYEWLYSHSNNGFVMAQLENVLKENAAKVGVKNFVTLFKRYKSDMIEASRSLMVTQDSFASFPGFDEVYNCGEWVCDEYGITCADNNGNEIVVCNHPLIVSRRFVAIDTKIEKLKLQYRKGGVWRSITADKKTLASSNSIVQLADYGLAVNSENSKHLVRFISDFEHLNYDIIPEIKSINRCGWVGAEGFSPYIGNIAFDGEETHKQMFESITSSGSEKAWFDLVLDIRKNGTIPARIILASSFASILIELCGGLPFFVHLWGDTGTGKTVGLMLAASVWANPNPKKHYIRSFNSTAVGQEMMAGFVNNLPLILDELQLAKDAKGQDKGIYKLAEGSGKSRGAKNGGMQHTLSWSNCILTSGEEPITSSRSDGGAINRTIEINCEENKLFDDPRKTFLVLSENYGFAGKTFVEKMSIPENIEQAKYIQEIINKGLAGFKAGSKKTADKQNLAASLILTADQLIDEFIFKDGCALDYKDISPFLSTMDEISSGHRGLQWISGWLVQNSHRFKTPEYSNEFSFEIWGKETDRQIFIIGNVFDKACTENGFNPQSFINWLARNGHIDVGPDGPKKTQRIGQHSTRCVCFDKKTFSGENSL